MIKNEKVYELKIEEDDELSGVSSISLVSEPAINISWVAFNKEKTYDFEEDDKFVKYLESKGQSEEEMLNEGWEIDESYDFSVIESDPNAESFEDTETRRVRYKYILNPKASGAKIIPTSRHFCKEMVSKNLVFRVEDIESCVNDFGQSPLVYRGGWNCRHVFTRILYKNTGHIINKAVINKNKIEKDGIYNDTKPHLDIMGYKQPDTRVKANPSFSKQNYAREKVSLDYDGTLSTQRGQDLAARLINEGYDVYVVTRRNNSELGRVYDIANSLGIPSDHVKSTDGELKWRTLKNLNIKKHYDNNPDEIKSIKENAPGIDAQKFDYVLDLPPYVDQLPKSGKTHNHSEQFSYLKPSNFESYSDYPDSVKHNAQRALDWAKKNGWGSCGTDVGKQRANQLAKGEPISADTVKRMYSYLSRHAGDLDSSKGFGDGCGSLMYAAWGGKTALSWAESKIKSFSKEPQMQNFAADEEQRITLGPAMIPDLKIIRRDEQGQNYYVFFTAETIKMICEKYMKNQFTRNNDLQHDGVAVPDVYVFESWIVEDPKTDKAKKYGFNVPAGTWMVSMKCAKTPAGDMVWNKIKSGELAGYSVSGFFEEIADFHREEMFLEQLANLLKKV